MAEQNQQQIVERLYSDAEIEASQALFSEFLEGMPEAGVREGCPELRVVANSHGNDHHHYLRESFRTFLSQTHDTDMGGSLALSIIKATAACAIVEINCEKLNRFGLLNLTPGDNWQRICLIPYGADGRIWLGVLCGLPLSADVAKGEIAFDGVRYDAILDGLKPFTVCVSDGQ